MKKKQLTSLFLATSLCVGIFAGCANKPVEQKPITPHDPVKQQSYEEKVRTDVVVASAKDIVTLDPHDTNDTTSARAFLLIHNSLLVLTPDAQIQPMLAKSYEQTSPTQYIFVLNQGVKFHNGEELKASDVKFSIERMQKNPKVKPYVERITAVNILDDYTVEINTDVPFAPLLMNLAGTQTSILNQKAVEEAEANGGKYGKNPVGTGPMTFQEWKINDKFVVVKNEDYFFEKGQTTSVTIRVIPEPSSQTIALETGEVDFLGSVPSIDITRVNGNKAIKTIEKSGPALTFVSFNQKKEIFQDVRVRQALAYATNKQNLVDVVLEGYGKTANSPFSSILPGYDETLQLYNYDVEKAKQLLTAAGYHGGFTMELVASGDESNRAAQLLQADYAKIDVIVNISLLEWGAFLDYLGQGNYEAVIEGWSNSVNPDNSMSPLFHSASCGIAGNDAYYVNPVVDGLIEQARTESDWAVREPIYKQLQKIIMEDAVIIPLYQKIDVIGMNIGAEGVVLYPSGSNRYTNMTIKETVK